MLSTFGFLLEIVVTLSDGHVNDIQSPSSGCAALSVTTILTVLSHTLLSMWLLLSFRPI